MADPDRRPRNRHGTPVDPVPWLVVTGFGFLLCYALGPLYLLSFGFSQPAALGASTLVFGGVVAGAYHRYVWTARPEFRGEIPGEVRVRRLLYGAVILVGVLFLLSLPLW